MASKLFGYCLMRWQQGAWTETELQIALSKGYITQEEYDYIIQQPQDQF